MRYTRKYGLLALVVATLVPGSAEARKRAARVANVTESVSTVAGLSDVAFDSKPGVLIAPDVRPMLDRLARDYTARTGQRLLVTSGTRTAAQQADAMVYKMASGGRIMRLYRRQRAARQIVRAFRRYARADFSHQVGAIRRVIDRQICRDVYISDHLKAGAIDLRSRGLSRRQKRSLRRAARKMKVYIKEEFRPPHFHLMFSRSAQAEALTRMRCRRGAVVVAPSPAVAWRPLR